MKGEHLKDALNRSVPQYGPPPGLEDKILAAAARTKPKVRRFSPWAVGLSAAALLLALANIVQLAWPKPQAARPGLMVVMLNGTAQAPKAFGTIVLDPDDDHGILAVRDLPVTSVKYELWIKTGAQPMSAGTFEVNGDGYGALLLTVPAEFREFHDFVLCPAGTWQPVLTGRY